MLSNLFLLSVAAAVVQVDFSISNSHNVASQGLGHQSMFKRHASNLNNNATADNSTVEPVVNASLTTSYNFYHGSLLVGEPAQEIEVLLDTGSPISWFYGPEGSFNNATQFFPNQSSTFHNINYTFSAAYGSGEYLGYWGSDRVAAPQFVSQNITFNATDNSTKSCSSQSTKSHNKARTHDGRSQGSNKHHKKSSCNTTNYSVPFEFGVITDFATSAGAPGLLGLGPHIKSAGPAGYLSLPEAYAKNNVTSSSAFSVFLEDKVGRFLFGGVDLQYVELPLYRFKPQSSLSVSPSSQASSTSWNIFLDSISLNSSGSPYTVSSRVTLDTGSPVSLLPPGFVNAVGEKLGLAKYSSYETYYVNGTSEVPKGNITFFFNGLRIDADIANFLVPGEYIWLDDGPKNVTALALMGSPNYLLGDAFFKSAYTVLDPATGDVVLGKRSKTLINATNSTNATSVVPFSQLLKNTSAVVNGSALVADSSSHNDVTTSTVEVATVRTPAGVLANQYLGSVPADKAASMTATMSSSTSPSASSSSSSSSSASSSSGSSSSGKKNAAVLASPSMVLGAIAISALLLV